MLLPGDWRCQFLLSLLHRAPVWHPRRVVGPCSCFCSLLLELSALLWTEPAQEKSTSPDGQPWPK